mmetsp:Transcript_2426/g.3354  ORF Transcript_2426/g.3354 Transcript_2426/m.3354 type:complete len:423 (-) Transcript_2426:176-1444(-)
MTAKGKLNKFEPFGSDIPFAEPQWYRGLPTPYYNESHVELRNRVRKFVDAELRPHVDEWEEKCASQGFEVDAYTLAQKAVKAGIFAPMIDEKLGGTPLPNGVRFDTFHDLVWIDELSRTGASGLIAGITIWTMALPPILNFGSQRLIDMVAKPVLRGEKMISLCISEPFAGSDVANLRTTAEDKGDHFLLNGQKKWITWAIHADYFTVACRTGGKGAKGVSMLVVDAKSPGVSVRRMKLQGNWLGGTCVVTFEDVQVPKNNIIGKLNEGFKPLMQNFNHERMVIALQAIRQSRLCIQDAVEFARNRKTFGKPLISHQVIRHKIAEMARLTESAFSFAETLAYQLENGVHNEIGGSMALLKVMSSKTFELCAREASQIIGGSSYTREGKGQQVERLYREVRSYAIPGGSEEILMDFAMKASRL